MVLIPFSSSHCSSTMNNYVLDRLVGGFSHLFPSLTYFLICCYLGFLAKLEYCFYTWSGCNLVLTNSQA
jgi:hypothetical protein